MNNLELKQIEIPSPIEYLKIGDDFSYKGQYNNGYDEGVSKINRFYKDVPFWDGIEKKTRKNDGYGFPVWMELENGKKFLLGFLDYKDEFDLANSFNSHIKN